MDRLLNAPRSGRVIVFDLDVTAAIRFSFLNQIQNPKRGFFI